MTTELDRLVNRLRQAEKDQRSFLSVKRPPRTNACIRRTFLAHRSTAHSSNRNYYLGPKSNSIAERAWLVGTSLRWIIERLLTRLKNPLDQELLFGRNFWKFGSTITPVQAWLNQGDYEKVLDWALRPDLYGYRWRDEAGEEFKRLVRDRRPKPELLKRKLTFSRTGDPEVPLRSEEGGPMWLIRINAFPDEPFYTALIGGSDAFDFDDWPRTWRR